MLQSILSIRQIHSLQCLNVNALSLALRSMISISCLSFAHYQQSNTRSFHLNSYSTLDSSTPYLSTSCCLPQSTLLPEMPKVHDFTLFPSLSPLVENLFKRNILEDICYSQSGSYGNLAFFLLNRPKRFQNELENYNNNKL